MAGCSGSAHDWVRIVGLIVSVVFQLLCLLVLVVAFGVALVRLLLLAYGVACGYSRQTEQMQCRR